MYYAAYAEIVYEIANVLLVVLLTVPKVERESIVPPLDELNIPTSLSVVFA